MVGFPSVLLHEGYHYLMARLLKIKVSRVVFLERHHFPVSYIEFDTEKRLDFVMVQLAPFIFGIPLLLLSYPYLKGLVGVIVFVIVLFSIAAGLMDFAVGAINLLELLRGKKTLKC
jgi:hypothetical protein